jgi:hypothetical protein
MEGKSLERIGVERREIDGEEEREKKIFSLTKREKRTREMRYFWGYPN